MDGPCGCGGDKKKLNRNEYKYWIVGCFFLFLFFAQKSKFEKKRVKTMQIVNVTNIQKWINDFHLDFCSDDDDDDRPVFFFVEMKSVFCCSTMFHVDHKRSVTKNFVIFLETFFSFDFTLYLIIHHGHICFDDKKQLNVIVLPIDTIVIILLCSMNDYE